MQPSPWVAYRYPHRSVGLSAEVSITQCYFTCWLGPRRNGIVGEKQGAQRSPQLGMCSSLDSRRGCMCSRRGWSCCFGCYAGLWLPAGSGTAAEGDGRCGDCRPIATEGEGEDLLRPRQSPNDNRPAGGAPGEGRRSDGRGGLSGTGLGLGCCLRNAGLFGRLEGEQELHRRGEGDFKCTNKLQPPGSEG